MGERHEKPHAAGDDPVSLPAPVVVSINPASGYAWLDFRIAMTWPRNIQRQEEARATIGFHAAKDPDGLAALTRHYQAASRAFAPNMVSEALIEANVAAGVKAIQEEIIDPSGGFTALARGPGLNQILREIDEARMPTQLVGLFTLYAAQLDLFHRDSPGGSKGRAWAILEADGSSGKIKIPAGYSAFRKSVWNKWKCISPLCAAHHVAVSLYGGPVNPIWSEEVAADILGWALWFRKWATEFYPKKGERDEKFISETEATIFDTDMPAVKPPLMGLSPERLELACKSWLNRS